MSFKYKQALVAEWKDVSQIEFGQHRHAYPSLSTRQTPSKTSKIIEDIVLSISYGMKLLNGNVF
jgi:hypothetical protein